MAITNRLCMGPKAARSIAQPAGTIVSQPPQLHLFFILKPVIYSIPLYE